jgi:putative sterol carrier protein/NAD(P)H-dependent FMN reductase
MNILVFNGSPRGARGNTEILIQEFLAGAHEAGAQSEVIYLRDKKINPCTGCFSCWTKTPGVCIHQDDMPELLEKLRRADLAVLATPLYIYTVSGLAKNFMDRLIPSAQPFINVENGLCTHPPRYAETEDRPLVLISNSGFPEQDHFSGLKETIRTWFRNDSHRIAGMICCAGGSLLQTPELKDGLTWYLDAVRLAGREVVKNGRIADETQATLDRPLMEDQHLFARMTNAYWRSLGLVPIEEETSNAKAARQIGREAIPLSAPDTMDTVGDLVAGMAVAFDPAAAGSLQAVVQFVVEDEKPGRYFLVIDNGRCEAYAGEHASPTMTLTTPAQVWLGITRGELSGATAFMTGQYKVSGDMGVLMQLEKLFPRAGR